MGRINISLGLVALTILLSGCGQRNQPHRSEDSWKLIWSDEFDTSGLPDPEKWDFDTSGNAYGWGNNESQYYTAFNLKNAAVENGQLHIRALKERAGDKDFTSARLRTKGRGDWKYGRYEIRARLPYGRGIWPAIWMLPTEWRYGKWPESGEIDIMEFVGYHPDSVFLTVHTSLYNGMIGTQKSKGVHLPDASESFHTYALEWDSLHCKWYIDDVLYFTYANPQTNFKEWPFDQEFHLLLNVAVGGNWGGKYGIDTAIFPQEMVVDYVRVYQNK
jgi:beta-glucanase (GH16 family)